MSGKCVLCNKYVPSGEALLILRGQLRADGEFKAGEIEGVACIGHPGEIESIKEELAQEKEKTPEIDASKFPVVFRL